MQQDESEKLKKHLSLLREEYVKLQDKYWKLEKKYNVMLATRGNNDDDSFVSNLLKTVAGLFEKELYSDLTVKLEQETFIKAHKFVLSARNGTWGDAALSETDSLDWRDMQKETAFSVLKWIYTDAIELGDKEDEFILDVMRCAKRFSLKSLQTKCEEALMSMVDVRNCVKFYQTADEIDAVNLRNHCSELISTHWNDFSGDDFVHMPASLMYNMCKAKTSHPLHTAIRLRREDVVFLYLIEYDAQLVSKVNEFDSEGDIPLDLALKTKQESVAKNLMAHKANVNVVDEFGKTLLHRALERKDKFSACFLIDNGAAVDIATSSDKESPLHLLCRNSNNQEMTEVAEKLVLQGADPNWQDVKGNSCLHQAIISRNVQIFKLLLGQSNIALALRNAEGMTPLALALQCLDTNETFAKLLVEKGASVDAKNPFTGDTLLHQAAKEENEVASIFLITNNAKVNSTNNQGETPLHIAASKGLVNLVEHLLKYGANCNAKTSPVSYSEALSSQAVNYAHNQTPLHFAVSFRQQAIIKKIFDFRKSNPEISIDLNVKNSKEETPLSLAIAMKDKLIADILIEEGADINIVDAENLTLLHRAIINNDMEGAIFLLRRGADIDTRTPTNLTPLQLAIENQLESVVQELCARGAEVNLCDEKGNNPLWSALEKGNEDIASILVQNGCDTNFWSDGPGGCWQTMLHRAIDENNEFVGCFLIRSGCDVNVTRRPSPDGKGEEEAYDGQTPLHMACQWGLENVVQTLLEHGADVNIADAEGKTPLHIAIINQHSPIISLLLSHPALNLNVRDKYGLSPFATAMNIKNNKAAQAILDRDPTAAEKFDGKGRNFLHIAIQKGDIESVLFLLSINVNIHSKVQDASQLSPLHLAVESGSDLIVRNLLLAGANINDLTVQKQSALHIAAEKDHHVICSILIENGIKYDAVDVNLNNALHIACQKGNLAACKVLLTESQIKAEALNLRGQNPLHLLAQFGKENAAAIYDLFISSMPEYPINKPDAEGNTPLLLAYKNGNSNLCKSLVRSGACLGTSNRNDINIFNCQVASKNLLYKILDFLPQESPWSEGDSCLECGLKFGITNRKHHCRHCGRLVCNKCSAKEIPILKFNQSKPVRVCEVCFDVLSRGFQF